VAEHPDLRDEQSFLDRAHGSLDAMRADASEMLESVLDLGRGGTFQSRTERDIVVRTSLARLAQLEIGDQALCFGRIDTVPDDLAPNGEAFHIGRLAVSGPDLEPLVVDWRAPVAEPFYRATGLDPQGLTRRRHLAVRQRTVVGLEDEYFATISNGNGHDTHRPGGGGSGHGDNERLLDDGMSLGGPGALLAALGQARTGQMGDIIGTIQREQDEIIRSPLAGTLVVQGGPGTGKTAVALHRAAYLLYTHRFPLERQGVLVVGPNPLFLRYIEQVLPSLGETGVTLSTVPGLVPEVKVKATEPEAVARLKGEARMADFITRAIRTRQRPLKENLSTPFGAGTLRLSVAESEEIVRQARRRNGTHNAKRRFVEQQVTRRLATRYRGRTAGEHESEDAEAVAEELAELSRRIRRESDVADALDRMWPRLSPHELMHDLFGAKPLLAAAGRGILEPDEQALLYRPRSSSLDDVAWTVADSALVDEARTLLGPRHPQRPGKSRNRATEEANREREEGGFWPVGLSASPLPYSNRGAERESDDERAYGHIVVDEVQDLSPMQLRMLARRSISGSMTLVGDIAQATGPWAPKNWDDVTAHLNLRHPARLVELTVSYRTPAEVVAAAARVLALAAPDIAPPRPVRQSGHQPVVIEVARAQLAEAVADAAATDMRAVAPGRTAVLAPAGLLPELSRVLLRRGLNVTDPRDQRGDGLAADLVLLPADETNGLEFDAVVVVEPALIAAVSGQSIGDGPPPATTRGLRTLYVALTRPTRRLSVVHSLALPVDLTETAPALL
jgi:DNA helicase IV